MVRAIGDGEFLPVRHRLHSVPEMSGRCARPVRRRCASRPTRSRRARAERKLAYERRSETSGHRLAATKIRLPGWPRCATNASRRCDARG